MGRKPLTQAGKSYSNTTCRSRSAQSKLLSLGHCNVKVIDQIEFGETMPDTTQYWLEAGRLEGNLG